MCWVMPPASRETTLVFRIASSSVVLAVVDVPENGHDGRALDEVRLVVLGHRPRGSADGVLRPSRGVPERPRDHRRSVEIDDLVDVGEHARPHQLLDDLDGLHLHALREGADAHRVGDGQPSKRHSPRSGPCLSLLFDHPLSPSLSLHRSARRHRHSVIMPDAVRRAGLRHTLAISLCSRRSPFPVALGRAARSWRRPASTPPDGTHRRRARRASPSRRRCSRPPAS